MQKISISLFLISAGIVTFANATPGRYRDGKIEFAISTVDGKPAFSQSEQDELLIDNPVGIVTPLTPEIYEVNLSTTLTVYLNGTLVFGFKNWQEFTSCQNRAGLRRKVMALRSVVDSMSDLPASETRDFRERIGWIRSYYLSLP